MRNAGRTAGPATAYAPLLRAQQLLATGEHVLDVQAQAGARVRVLGAGDTNKNDPNDALPAAIAALPALPSKARRELTADDHTTPRLGVDQACLTGGMRVARAGLWLPESIS